MLLESVYRTELAKSHEVVSMAISARRGSNPMIAGLDKGIVQLKIQRQESLFPDEEHSHEPRRQFHFAALSRNSLPNSEFVVQKRQLKCSPKRKKRWHALSAKAVNKTLPSTAVQMLRKKIQRQPKSPKTRNGNGYIIQQLDHGNCTAQEQPQCEERVEGEKDCRQVIEKTSQRDIMTEQEDYTQYLYLASLYGPLEALFYCCCPAGMQGRVYMLLVDVCARRLQRWAPKMVAALRRYWVNHLAQELCQTSITEGVDVLVASFYQQRQAAALLQRLRLLRASRALRAWSQYANRMDQVRDKIRLAPAKDLESRFNQWRDNIEARKTFKCQLKRTAKRKAMESRFDQWHVWCENQKRLRCHLAQRWTQAKRASWKVWCTFVRNNLATKILQRAWRFYTWRVKRDHSARLIERVYRGWRSRQYVKMLREKMEIHDVMLRVLNSAAWEAQHEVFRRQRLRLLEIGLHDARKEAQCVVYAENAAATFVTSELSKVIRGAMHRKLEQQVELLKLDESVLPCQAAKTNNKLREMATSRLIVEQRALARREAITAFCAGNAFQNPENSSLCLICQVYTSHNGNPEDFGFPAHHDCLRNVGVCFRANLDPRCEVENWGKLARAELTVVDQSEREYVAQLLNVEPSTASLWRSIAFHEQLLVADNDKCKK